MSNDERIQVQEAINVLCRARNESLRPYSSTLLAFFHKLQSQVIPDHSTAEIASTNRSTSPPASDCGLVPLHSNSPRSFRTPPHSYESSAFSFRCETPLGALSDQHTLSQPRQQRKGLIEKIVLPKYVFYPTRVIASKATEPTPGKTTKDDMASVKKMVGNYIHNARSIIL